MFRLAAVLIVAVLLGGDAPPTWGEAAASAMPPEVTSSHFLITIQKNQPVPVIHAAENYYFLNFNVKKRTTVSVTADIEGYWDRGVEVQPWRLGIRPAVKGRTITFDLDGPAKISITRPGDYLGGAEMLFLFAGTAEKKPPRPGTAGMRYFGPGVHRENIDAKSGDQIYLAPGAVVFGSLNLWEVENVHVFGRGLVIYDGPQNPADDDGWMHKRNWRAIVMHNARHIAIEGITCVVRSRTWMIQMRDSRDIHFDDIKVIGGSPGNANQDGMDWLGGGDTTVKNSFFRAADDIFAMQGNWEGYSAEALAIPGHEVSNITVEDSVLSTSISNVVRSGWPHKNFDSHHFVMRNTDVLHMGLGGCGVPFALLEMWADPAGTGHHSDYLFDNIRMDDWYSLVQLLQPSPEIKDIRFRDVFGLELPSMVPSSLLGSVSGVDFSNVSLANRLARTNQDIPLQVLAGASDPSYADSSPKPSHASFSYSPGSVVPGQTVEFDATSSAAVEGRIVKFEWTFGDGSHATGKRVRHRFPDDSGTLSDRSGRFRVLLHTTDSGGRNSWAYEPVVVTSHRQDAVEIANVEPGLRFQYFEQDTPSLKGMADAAVATASGTSPEINTSPRRRPDRYGIVFDGYITVPSDGGYTFTLLSNDAGSMEIDSVALGTSPPPWPQVCGSVGNAVRPVTGSLGLQAGRHRIRVAETHSVGQDGFALLWQGPGVELSRIPAAALSHLSTNGDSSAKPHAGTE